MEDRSFAVMTEVVPLPRKYCNYLWDLGGHGMWFMLFMYVYVGKHRQTSWRADKKTSGHQGSNVTTIPDMEEEHR